MRRENLESPGEMGHAESQKPSMKSSQIESRDVQLLSRTARGDLQAFEALYCSFFPRLTRFLDRMTRSAALIEEIVNDTMLVVWQKAGTFNETCKVSTWIFSIAYLKALKAIRGLDPPVEADFEFVVTEAADWEPEHAVLHRQIRASVSRSLDALPIEQRTVVSLTYYHGMGYQEIAETMGCPVNTVKTRMFHARRRLKTMLSSLMESL